MLKKEQFEKLKPYETHLQTALSDYVHGLYSRDVNVLSEVYSELGKKLINKSCPGCVINMCKELGQEYFKYKERYYGKNKTNKSEKSNRSSTTRQAIKPTEN